MAELSQRKLVNNNPPLHQNPGLLPLPPVTSGSNASTDGDIWDDGLVNNSDMVRSDSEHQKQDFARVTEGMIEDR